MFNPREIQKTVGQYALHAQRTGRRLLFSGIGFSAAYFLDPVQGPARRRAAIAAFHRTKRAIAAMRADDAEHSDRRDEVTPEPPVITGSRYTAEGLKVAR